VGDVVEPLVKFVELGLLRVVPFFDRRHRAALPEDAELGLPHDFGIARDEIIGAALRNFATPWAPPLPAQLLDVKITLRAPRGQPGNQAESSKITVFSWFQGYGCFANLNETSRFLT